jgi:D-alanyl-D-alanine carboxypeptidase (penicillin-binding protein 5/6)
MVKQGPSAGPSGSEARLDPAIADIARSLPVLLRHLHAQARAQSPGGLQLDGPGAFALWLLHARGPLTAGELAQRLRITPAGVTALVARLGGGGYVQSTADLEDRRRKRVTITPADVADDYADERQDETSIPISTGEQLTERQLLEGLLVHSANDLADVLARYDAGSIGAFVERMNRAAASLGLHGTRYVDPSGFDPGSVSTARDLLRLASVDMRIPAFAAIVAMPSVSLPEAGQVMNYVQAVGTDGIVGVKSGFTAAAEGCVVLAARRYVGSVPVLVLAAVTGQAGYDALLKASQSALAIIDAAASGLLATPVLPEGRQAGVLEAPWASPRRYAGVVTGSAAVVLGWPGQPVSIQVEPRDLRRVRRGSVVATAVVRLGAEDEVVPLRATRSVRSPSLGWRVLRG